MTTLRVLTGYHAGVQINLSSSAYRIAADDEADIQLTDWTFEPTKLQIMSNQVHFHPASTPLGDTASGMRLESFQPRRFGDVVLCVGPSGMQWPSDQQLLESLVQSAQEMAAQASRFRIGRVPALAMSVLGVVIAIGVFVAYSVQPAQALAPQESFVSRVQHAVSALPVDAVTVRAEGERVVVEGLLPTNEDVNALRLALSSLPAERIDHRYASIAQISQSVVEAMRLPGAAVSYLGGGVFRLQARAAHPQQVSQDAARVAADLAPQVERIELAIEALPAPGRVAIAAALMSDGLHYVQTRDGAKYIELSSGSTGESITPAAQREPLRSNISFSE